MTCREYESRTREFLLLCSGLYDSLVDETEQLRKMASAEAVCAWLEMVAGFASMHHSGRFADGAIENIALDIGTHLRGYKGVRFSPLMSSQILVPPRRRRVLHVASFISSQGGHSRNLLHWIEKDRQSHHSLVLTRQRSIPPYTPLMEAAARSGGVFVSIPDPVPLLERARWLRCFARDNADLIVLHMVPNDIVPIVAFVEGCSVPVALVNNADHLFWLGSSVADTVINLREISITSSRECRHTRNDQLLPIPLLGTDRQASRADARCKLGVPLDQTVLLTVGRALKYTPSIRQNFFHTARAILEHDRQAHLYLVGLTAADHAASSAKFYHERMHFVGQVQDASLWQLTADIYLEGFPFGSQTALLESVLPGAPCVRVYDPLSPLLAADDIALTGIVDSPDGEKAYIASACEFIADREKGARLGAMLRGRVLRYHVEDTWQDFLTNIYETTGKIKHEAVKLPSASAAVRPVDLAISEYHGASYAGTADAKSTLTAEIHQEILGIAYNLRQAGFYKDAFRLVKKNWDRESLLFAAKLIPHRFLYKRRIRQGKEVR